MSNVIEACTAIGNSRAIGNVECLSRTPLALIGKLTSTRKDAFVSRDVLEKVKNALPPQPWQPRVHQKVAEELNVAARVVSSAINELIERGIVFRQHAGVLYDAECKVVAP